TSAGANTPDRQVSFRVFAPALVPPHHGRFAAIDQPSLEHLNYLRALPSPWLSMCSMVIVRGPVVDGDHGRLPRCRTAAVAWVRLVRAASKSGLMRSDSLN